jgi:mRNA interferase YafQ
MLQSQIAGQFKKDFKKMQKRGKDMSKLKLVMHKLADEETIKAGYKDHMLIGDYKDRRECHIEPDWLLIYKLDKKGRTITFERTGTHADLFE